MSDIARATLVGRLTRDPELNQTGKVLTLSLAVNRRTKKPDDTWGDEASFFDVKVFGNRAGALAGLLAKGRQIAVDARVVQERWETESGKGQAVRFYADEVVLVGKGEAGGQGAASFSGDAQVAVDDPDDMPF